MWGLTELNQVVVGNNDGNVQLIWWLPGHSPEHAVIRQFNANSIVGVAGFVGADQLNQVVVGTNDGNVNLIWWLPGQARDHEVITGFNAKIVAVAGFVGADQYNQVVVGTRDGRVHDIYWHLPIGKLYISTSNRGLLKMDFVNG